MTDTFYKSTCRARAREKVSSPTDTMFASYPPHISYNRPHAEKCDVEVNGCLALKPLAKAHSGGAASNVFGEENEQEVGERIYKKKVVADGFGDVAMKHGMERTLKATARALPTRNELEWAFGDE